MEKFAKGIKKLKGSGWNKVNILNQKMKLLMEEKVCKVDEKKVNSIVKGILENTKKIHDCVIYDENNEVNNEINFNKIISMYYD